MAVVAVDLGLSTIPSKVSFPFPLAASVEGLLGATTSPRASRFRFPGRSALESVTPDAFALEAAVARVTPLVAPVRPLVPDAPAGLVRVTMREGRALAFSFSFTAVALVVRSGRRA